MEYMFVAWPDGSVTEETSETLKGKAPHQVGEYLLYDEIWQYLRAAGRTTVAYRPWTPK